MNTKSIYTAITLISLFFSSAVIAHDPSKHAATKEKPNCEAMHKMDLSSMDMNDPVVQAMMQQCGKSTTDGHHDNQAEKPACTQEHAKLGHCTLESDASDA
jgi:hypothetical protein